MNKHPYVIGIDAGTSKTKAVAFDLQGNELYTAGITSCTEYLKENWIESNMDNVWNDVFAVVKDVVSTLKSSHGTPLTVGITSTGDGTWIIDKDGNPVRPGIYWCDGRAQEEVNALQNAPNSDKSYSICGTSIFTGTQVAQLHWLKKHEPEVLEKARYIFHEKDWILYKFTGLISTDATDESLTNINLKTREYDEDLFDIFQIMDLRAKFPNMLPTSENRAPVLDHIATSLGLEKHTIISAGPMDVSSHALGVGAVKPGHGSSVLGTAGLHQVIMDNTYIDVNKRVGMTLCHAVPDTYVRLVAAMIATPNLDWGMKVLGYNPTFFQDYLDIEESLMKLPIGCDGLIFHPYIFPGGERGPFVKPSAKGSYTGINQQHTREHLLRAIYEGVALSTLDCYSHMPVDPTIIYLSGGGAKSAFWAQMICDALAKPVAIPNGSEFGAKGAAINALVAAGIYSNYEEAVSQMIRQKEFYEPRAAQSRQFAELYELYQQGYTMQMDFWEQRSTLLEKWKR